tara:strand:- start:23362 stop:23466 length:105 start_codon:yes stop_codon:yes gene_type:complete
MKSGKFSYLDNFKPVKVEAKPAKLIWITDLKSST